MTCLPAPLPDCVVQDATETGSPLPPAARPQAEDAVESIPAHRNPWPVYDDSLVLRHIQLESGATLDRVTVRYRLEGEIAPDAGNVVLVVHALTGTPEASSWWKGVIGEGQVLDPTRHAILCTNLLGGCAGTTGPRDTDSDAFPAITTRDQATVLAGVLDALGIHRPLLVCGGSLGGMVTLEFAASFPHRIEQGVVLAAPAAQTAQGIAWNAIMRRAIAIGGAEDGLALARMVGMLSYRTPESFENRFAHRKNDASRFEMSDWLSAHGNKLVARFHASSYVALIDAMDAHDVGRGRGGVEAALRPVGPRLSGAGIPGDLLYTAESVRSWCVAAGADYRDLPSQHGHDGFLMESGQVSALLATVLQRAASR